MFGPFYKKTKDDIWHWIKSCPEFPQGSEVHVMIGSKKPEPQFLCAKCTEIEINGFKAEINSLIE